MREAIRIVENHGAARMRRGPGGGLIVTAPDSQAVVQSATLLLDQSGVSASDLLFVRTSLELICVRLAMERIDEEGIARLRSVLEHEVVPGPAGLIAAQPGQLHRAIAAAAGNPALKFFVEIIMKLMAERTVRHAYTPQEVEVIHSEHVAIVEAIAAGDAERARHRLIGHLTDMSQYYRERLGFGVRSQTNSQ